MAKKARCPVCKGSFKLGANLEGGDIFDCPGCSAELRLTKLDPTEVEEENNIGDDFWDDDEKEEF